MPVRLTLKSWTNTASGITNRTRCVGALPDHQMGPPQLAANVAPSGLKAIWLPSVPVSPSQGNGVSKGVVSCPESMSHQRTIRSGPMMASDGVRRAEGHGCP